MLQPGVKEYRPTKDPEAIRRLNGLIVRMRAEACARIQKADKERREAAQRIYIGRLNPNYRTRTLPVA